MDEDKIRFILEGFTAKIKEDTDQKLKLIDSKLNTINSKLDETNNILKEVIKKTETNSEDIKAIQEEHLKHNQGIHNNKNKIHLNDMRIRELEEELDRRNNAETDRLNQLYTTVGVLKAQIAQLTTKPAPQPTFRAIVTKNSDPKSVKVNVTHDKPNKVIPNSTHNIHEVSTAQTVTVLNGTNIKTVNTKDPKGTKTVMTITKYTQLMTIHLLTT